MVIEDVEDIFEVWACRGFRGAHTLKEGLVGAFGVAAFLR